MLRFLGKDLFWASFAILNGLAWLWLYSQLPLEQAPAPAPLPREQAPLDDVFRPPPPPPPPLHRWPEPVVLTLVMIGTNVAEEGTITIKTAIMHSSRPLHFHIICSEDAIPILESRFRLFSRPTYPVKVFYYPVTDDYVKERCERAGLRGAWPPLSKVFIHELVHPSVEKTMFVDTDMMFAVDPLLLWNEFDTMAEQALVAFPTLDDLAHAGDICSCVMLLKLAKMRDPAAPFMPSTLLPETQRTSIGAAVFAEAGAKGIPTRTKMMKWDAHDPQFSDQGVYHVVWWYRRELFKRLSLRWDVTNCRARYGLTLGQFESKDAKGRADGEEVTEEEQIARQEWTERTPEDGELLVPGILHFNCQWEGGEIAWKWEGSHELNTFGPMVTTAQRYKWIWLNRGNGTAKVTRRRMTTARWWDEQVAEAEAAQRRVKINDLDDPRNPVLV